MAERKPVVLVSGQLKELPAGDTLPPQAPASHSHATSDVTGLDAALSGKEPAISTGSTSQYWSGDKSWRDFFTDVRAATLTGLSTATNAAITAADTVLSALGRLQAQITGHTGATSGAHEASAIHVAAATPPTSHSIPEGTVQGLLATNWQDVSGLMDWQSFHTSGAGTQHPASTISNTPSGGVAATNVQAAINELDSEKANAASVREKLTAARTYYVRTDGSDSNTGLANTSGGAFLTIQKAIDTVAGLDLGIYDATIYIGTGTWTAANTLKTLVGAGKCVIRGINADTTSTVISTTSAPCFVGTYVGTYQLEYLKLQNATSGNCLQVVGSGAVLRYQNVNFGSSPGNHVFAGSGSYVVAVGHYAISGGANNHVAAVDVASAAIGGSVTVTLTGTPAFPSGFLYAGRASSVLAAYVVFSGSATGKRYAADSNGVITTLGGATYLPGDAAGTTATGGVYQ